MPKRLTIAAILFAAIALLAIPASASASSPWWQVLDGSRPSNLWEPTDKVQEITTTQGSFEGIEGILLGMEVDGELVGCLAPEGFLGEEACPLFVGAPWIFTAGQLQAALEPVYGSEVEVTGGPVGGDPFLVTVPGPPGPTIGFDKANLEEGKIRIGTGTNKVLSAGGSGRLVVTVTNLGDEEVDAENEPVTIVDELPEGVIATGVEAFAGERGTAGPVDCELETDTKVICSFKDQLPAYESIEIEVLVSLQGEPPSEGAPGHVSVSGGGAPPAVSAQQIEVSPEKVAFGIERFFQLAEDHGGGEATRAATHPFQLTNTIQLNAGTVSGASREAGATEQPAQPRNFRFVLAPGLVGNATAVPQCPLAQFFDGSHFLINKCPDEAAIGVATVTIVEKVNIGFTRLAVPLFNLKPGSGEPARFGFTVAGVPVMVDTALDTENDYRIVASVKNTTQLAQVLSATVTIWGTPGDPRHDAERGWGCAYHFEELACEEPPAANENAFLRLPANCDSPQVTEAQAEPWHAPLLGQLAASEFASQPLGACNQVPFDPSIEGAPSSKLAEAPSGLSFSVRMPNSGLLNPDAVAEGQPKKVEVELPEGMTLNPSAAEGLAVCTQADYNRERFNSRPGEGCPDASKLGSVEIDTPLIEENPKGSLYIAKPYDNPFNSLLATYIVARSPERGVLVKLPVKISPNEQTGQLIATVDDAPQTPFSSFDLSFREGGRAPLVTPPACGDYEIKARFTPWSAQDPDNPAPNEIVTRTSSFEVQRGVDGGACPPGGVPPFDPEFQAGSINNNAGAHTDFNMRLIREDGEQNMTRFSAVLPPGVLGKLAGIDKCPDSAIAKAKSRTGANGGHEELADPSCPANSEIGRSLVGAGVGSVLTRVPGKVYLGGPFNGAPLSVIAITPVVAGPFDVGVVVVQEALTLNARTAEVEVDGSASDPIPHILKGIPAKLRDLRVYVDRPDFIINPTSCDESSVKSTLFGSFLDVFNPADDKPADLAARYQAANCANLGFKPNLKLNLKGGTKRGGHPGLKALYKPRKGDANVEGLVVRLPRSAFLDQAHIRTICTRVQFAADNCPKAAQYGYIKAWTPLLDEPLQGPVWLRSSNHKLPDLVFDLHGLVDVEVATRIDSARGGIRATVENAPDAPLSKVELRMQGGKKGLIINSRNLCGSVNRANVEFAGHNGKEARANPVMRADGCRKATRKSKRR